MDSFSHYRHYRQSIFAIDSPAFDDQALNSISSIVPLDAAVVVTDEDGNIKFCNAEAQNVFHCSLSCNQSKKINSFCKIVRHDKLRYAPTLWEMVHSTRRPLAFPDVEITLPGEKARRMDVCTVWLNESREGHLRIAFVFSSQMQKQYCYCSNIAVNTKLTQVVDAGAEIQEGIVVHKHHIIIETSSTFDVMIGYSEGENIGRDISCLMTEDSSRTLLHAVKEHDTSVHTGLVIQRNNFLLPVEFRTFPLTLLSSDVVITRLYALKV